MVLLVLNALFFLGFGLTLFGLPYVMLVAQVSGLILGVYYAVQVFKAM